MKIMSHDRVRNFLRRFNNPEQLQLFCNRHKKFLKKRLPLSIMFAVKKKSNRHYTEKADVLINTVIV